jgi:hypothetical protein
MAYEAYIAAKNDIAQKVYQAWSTGGDYQALMDRLCRESNVEEHHVGYTLTGLIREGHLKAQAVRTDN